KEDSLESFILDVYNRCKDIGLLPENIAFHLADLLEFSKTAMPLSKIPDYIKEKTNEKAKLEQEIEELKEQLEELQLQKEAAVSLRDTALQDAKMTRDGVKWYSDLREGLRKYEIPIDDVSKLAKLVNSLRQYEYNAEKVINEFSNLEGLTLQHQYLQETLPSLEERSKDLKRECSTLQTWIAIHKQVLSKYHDLEVMGFGLNQLQFLWTTVREIARENNNTSRRSCNEIFVRS
ncbi:MAG: hypothetical protein WA667_11795, partial [Candidatus Nitrosopolaris sp.]